MDRVGDIFIGIMAALASFLAATLVVLLFLHIFLAGPTGEYYVKADYQGYMSSVYADQKYDGDRLIFRGPNGQAWKVYDFVTSPSTLVQDPGKTTLAPL